MHNTDAFYASKWFQDYFKTSPQSFICKAVSPAFEIVAVSDVFINMLGLSRDTILGKNTRDIFTGTFNDKSISNKLVASLQKVSGTGQPDSIPDIKYTIPIAGTDTMKVFYWSCLNEPVFDDEGVVAYIINITINVTDQQPGSNAKEESLRHLEAYRKELTLNRELADLNGELVAINEELITSREVAHKNEKQFRLIADNISQLVWIADATGYIYWYNNRWYEYTGSTFEEMQGWGWQKVHHPDYVVPVTDQFKKNLEQGTDFDDTFPLLGTDGTYRWFLTRVIPARNEAGEITNWFGSNTDITELLNARDELITTYENLKIVSTNLNQAINLAHIDLWSVDLSTGLLTLTPRSKKLHGLPPEAIIDYNQSVQLLSPDYRNIVDNAIQTAISNMSTFTVEYIIIPADGSKHRWMKSTGQVFAGKDGKAARMQGIMVDITEQKEDEQRKNDFIAMVSHELKTPLTSLNVYIQLLQMIESNKNDKFTTDALDKANRQVSKMNTLINGFLNMSRLESGKIHIDKQHFDMADLIKEMEKETMETITTHQVIFAPVAETFVYADRDKTGQVINNFISNAVKYSRADSTINVACITNNEMAQVSVQDQGKGIQQKDIDKLFDRYYRVEGEEMNTISGFGIGLYLSAEIIQRHDGKIWVESEPGKGSVFYFSIPVAKA